MNQNIEKKNFTEKVLLVGCGEIGQLFLEQILGERGLKEIWVIQPSLSKKGKYHDPRVHFVKNLTEVDKNFKPTLVLLAFRPQDVPMVLPEYKRFNSALFVTPIASVPINYYKDLFGENTKIVRIMPNVASSTGFGVNLACMHEKDPDLLHFTYEFMAPLGMLLFCNDETKFDEISSMTGSGIAYYLQFSASIVEQIKKSGVSEEEATKMARLLLIGTADFVTNNPETSFAELINKIATEGGITNIAIRPLVDVLGSAMRDVQRSWIGRNKEIYRTIQEKSDTL